MDNTDTLPTWDEIFASLGDEVARYEANIRWLNEIANKISND
jgi:hypothetical protein